jgi:uncharacterized protein (DUF2267 family)
MWNLPQVHTVAAAAGTVTMHNSHHMLVAGFQVMRDSLHHGQRTKL